MSKKKSRSVARSERRGARERARNHDPLLLAVQDEMRRMPVKARQVVVKPLTDAQRRYDAGMRSADIVFGAGPAGTGKTWFAVMRAAEELKAGRIKKIYLTRPNVEVERGFGFLPGELDEKYEPYLLPVREALEEAFGTSHLEHLLKTKKIDPRPLAFMRGATIKDGWLIADEMQNATKGEFKMLLSRIGESAKFVINGDATQCDLPDASRSGFNDAIDRLRHLDECSVVTFGPEDIVRSGLCQKIVAAYEQPQDSVYIENQSMNDNEGLRRVLNAGCK